MKNLRGVLGVLLVTFLFQFTFVSCTDDSEIIKSQNVEQTQNKVKFMVDPANGGGGDDDDYEDGN